MLKLSVKRKIKSRKDKLSDKRRKNFGLQIQKMGV